MSVDTSLIVEAVESIAAVGAAVFLVFVGIRFWDWLRFVIADAAAEREAWDESERDRGA